MFTKVTVLSCSFIRILHSFTHPLDPVALVLSWNIIVLSNSISVESVFSSGSVRGIIYAVLCGGGGGWGMYVPGSDNPIPDSCKCAGSLWKIPSAPAVQQYVLQEAFPLGLERDGSVVKDVISSLYWERVEVSACPSQGVFLHGVPITLHQWPAKPGTRHDLWPQQRSKASRIFQ